jgi:hypothetical protein
MLEKKIINLGLDIPWIDLTGSLDYLPLKKPIRIVNNGNEFYVKEFELTFPRDYTIEEMKKGLRKRYEELLFPKNEKSREKNQDLWERIVKSDVVDYDAFWDNISTGKASLFKLVEKKDKNKRIKLINSNRYKEIPRDYKNYFEKLSPGFYKGSIKYSNTQRIKSIDEICPVSIEDYKRFKAILGKAIIIGMKKS